MDAEQSGFPDGAVLSDDRTEWFSLHILGDRHMEVFQDGRGDVQGLHECSPAFSFDLVAGIPHKKRGMGNLIVERHDTFGPPIMFP